MEVSLHLSSDNFKLFYLDHRGEIQEDHNALLGGSIARIFTSILGLRDYNITHILPKMEALGESDQRSLSSKCAKHFGISREQLENIQKISAYYLTGEKLSIQDRDGIKLFLKTLWVI